MSEVNLKNSNFGGDGGWEKIETKFGDGSTNLMTFSNIPQHFQDLEIELVGRSSVTPGTFTTCSLQFNGSTTTYAWERLFGNGTTTAQSIEDIGVATYIYVAQMPGVGIGDANLHGSSRITIPSYKTPNMYRHVRIQSNSYIGLATGHYFTDVINGIWRTNSPITSILVGLASAVAWTTTSRATLYGRR